METSLGFAYVHNANGAFCDVAKLQKECCIISFTSIATSLRVSSAGIVFV